MLFSQEKKKEHRPKEKIYVGQMLIDLGFKIKVDTFQLRSLEFCSIIIKTSQIL